MNSNFTITSWKDFADVLKRFAFILAKPEQTSRPSDWAITFKAGPKNRVVLLSACDCYQTFSTELPIDSPPSETVRFAVDIFKAPLAPKHFDSPVQVIVNDKYATFKFGAHSAEAEIKTLRFHAEPTFYISKAIENDMNSDAIEIGVDPNRLIDVLKALKVKGEPVILRITQNVSPIILSSSKGLSAICPVKIRNKNFMANNIFEHLKKMDV